MGWLKTVFSGSKPPTENNYQKMGLNPKYTFDNFVVGQNNRFAHAAAVAISENPAKTYNPFFIHGGVGLGKTHLLKAIQGELEEAYYINAKEFVNFCFNFNKKSLTSKDDFLNYVLKDGIEKHQVKLILFDDLQFLKRNNKEHIHNKLFSFLERCNDYGCDVIFATDTDIALLDFHTRISTRLTGENFTLLKIEQETGKEFNQQLIKNIQTVEISEKVSEKVFNDLLNVNLTTRQFIKLIKIIEQEIIVFGQDISDAQLKVILASYTENSLSVKLKSLGNKIMQKNGLVLSQLHKRDFKAVRTKKEIIKEALDQGFDIKEIAEYLKTTVQAVYHLKNS